MEIKNPLKTFIIYAHEDFEHKVNLLTSLKPLERKKEIEIWHDGRILPGDNWEQKTFDELNSSELIIILLTPYCLASDFIFTALESAVNKGAIEKAKILPILVIACNWELVDFLVKLHKVPLLNGMLKPVTDNVWQKGEAWREVVDQIDKLISSREEKKDENIFKNTKLGGEQKKHKLRIFDILNLYNISIAILLPIVIILFYNIFFSYDFEKDYELVEVEGGYFTMGNNNKTFISKNGPIFEDEDEYETSIKSFKIGKYEVTQKQWYAIMGYNNSSNKRCRNCPVDNVSWDECQNFIKKVNLTSSITFRLPTETEWEYAAKGGIRYTDSKYYAGSNDLNRVGWYIINSGGETQPVGKKEKNQLGIHDLSGNVREWCADDYQPYPNSGDEFKKGKINRGGSATEDVDFARCSFRGRLGKSTKNHNNILLGFRLAAD